MIVLALGRWVSRSWRWAESASRASAWTVLKNFGDWPSKRRSAVKLLIVATAPPFWSSVGRTIEQAGRACAQEVARFGQDQVGLVELSALGVEVREGDSGLGVGDAGERLGDGVSCLVVPEREVVGFDAADGDDDAQHLETCRLERHDAVEARAALLDVGEVKAGGVGDRLHAPLVAVLWAGPGAGRFGRRVLVVQGDSGLVLDRDGLREGRSEVGVLGAAVADVPARVDV